MVSVRWKDLRSLLALLGDRSVTVTVTAVRHFCNARRCRRCAETTDYGRMWVVFGRYSPPWWSSLFLPCHK